MAISLLVGLSMCWSVSFKTFLSVVSCQTFTKVPDYHLTIESIVCDIKSNK